LGVGETHVSVDLLKNAKAVDGVRDRDPCTGHSDMGDCTVVNGATGAEAAGRGLKDEGEPPAALLVEVFYKEENIIYQEWLAMRSRNRPSPFYQLPTGTHLNGYIWRLRDGGCDEAKVAYPWQLKLWIIEGAKERQVGKHTTLVTRTKGSMYTPSKCTLEGRPLGVPVGVCGSFVVLVDFGVAGAFWQDWPGASSLARSCRMERRIRDEKKKKPPPRSK